MLAQQVDKSEKMSSNLTSLSTEHTRILQENREKDERVVKTYADYMETYEALLKLRSQKSVDIGAKQDKKPKKAKKNKVKEIFDDLIGSNDASKPRMSVREPDGKLPYSHFNMSGGSRPTVDSDEESEFKTAIKELEDENKRLQSLMEYKDYELSKKKKQEEFGYD
jgi:hypothetical protein